nr:GNAT family N-acetyltransferase [Arthrobacter sp. zg-Y769]
MAFLPAVEEASDTLLDGMTSVAGLPVLPPPATAAELAASLHILVAGDPPVGFARLEEVDGQAHLEQLSVHPDVAGAGLGRALVQAALDWAREQGYASMTLCTFRGSGSQQVRRMDCHGGRHGSQAPHAGAGRTP